MVWNFALAQRIVFQAITSYLTGLLVILVDLIGQTSQTPVDADRNPRNNPVEELGLLFSVSTKFFFGDLPNGCPVAGKGSCAMSVIAQKGPFTDQRSWNQGTDVSGGAVQAPN